MEQGLLYSNGLVKDWYLQCITNGDTTVLY